MDIDQLSRVTGVPVRHIRQYQQLGLLGLKDTASFDDSDIHSLKIIKLATFSGYSIKDVLAVVEAKNRGDYAHLSFSLEQLASRAESLTSTAKERKKALNALMDELKGLMADA